jgi:hypothetical protein
MALDETEDETRRIQRDIERTREDMDHTLTELERRLSPGEILHQGAETVREGVRSRFAGVIDAMTDHAAPLALGAALVGAGLALRPSATDRRRRQAEQDFERAWAVLSAGLARAKQRSERGTAKLERLLRESVDGAERWAGPALRTAERVGRDGAAEAWRFLRHARDDSRAIGRTLGNQASAHPLAALLVAGVTAGVLGYRRGQRTAYVGTRRRHRTAY